MVWPVLIGMALGAVGGSQVDKDDPIRGALIGGTLGALTGGVAGGAGAGGTTAATGTTGATTAGTTAATGTATTGAATTAGGVAKAGEIGGLTLAQKAQIASSAQQSLTPQAQQALLAEIGKGSAAQGVQTYAGAQSANPLISSALNTGSGAAAGGLTAQQLAQAQQGIAMMTPEEQQQQQQVAPVPLPQSRFEPFTPEEQMSRVGGNEPLFVPRGLFEEERQKMAFDYIDNNMDDLLYEELRMRGLA